MEETKRPRGNPNWVKGKSGNPNGRPKSYDEMKALAQQHTPEAIATLAAIMRNVAASDIARISAANSLLDRGFGKPAQSHDIRIQTPLSAADDAALEAIARGSGSGASVSETSQARSNGVVH